MQIHKADDIGITRLALYNRGLASRRVLRFIYTEPSRQIWGGETLDSRLPVILLVASKLVGVRIV
jgi:hypothetical protein